MACGDGRSRRTRQLRRCATSRTGSEPYNDRLSAQCVTVIRQKLAAEASELMPRTKSSGVGSRGEHHRNGDGDATDALDRRVELKIVGC